MFSWCDGSSDLFAVLVSQPLAGDAFSAASRDGFLSHSTGPMYYCCKGWMNKAAFVFLAGGAFVLSARGFNASMRHFVFVGNGFRFSRKGVSFSRRGHELFAMII